MALAVWPEDKPVVWAWGQYLAGLLWTMHRVHVGGTADFPFYFLGEVSASGSRVCLPVVYAIKEALPWHLLSAWALLLVLARVWSSALGVRPLLGWLPGHPAGTRMLGWLVLYCGVAIQSNLNIGVRHPLPIFPWTAKSKRSGRSTGSSSGFAPYDLVHEDRDTPVYVGKYAPVCHEPTSLRKLSIWGHRGQTMRRGQGREPGGAARCRKRAA